MGVFRSEEMECYRVVVPKPIGYQCMATLGETEMVELINNNSRQDKPFVDEMIILEDLDLKLRKVVKDIKKIELSAVTPNFIPLAPLQTEIANIGTDKRTSLNLFYKLYFEYDDITSRYEDLKREMRVLLNKHKALLTGHQYMIESAKYSQGRNTFDSSLIDMELIPNEARFVVQVGILPISKNKVIEMLIWRLTLGNTKVLFISAYPNSTNYRKIRRNVVITVTHGNKSAEMISKLCSGYNIPLTVMPWSAEERLFLLNRIIEHIFKLKGIINESSNHRNVLLKVASKHCKKWFIEIEKMKATYGALNMTDWYSMDNHCIITFWLQKCDVGHVFRALTNISKTEEMNNPVMYKITQYDIAPPTYIKVNKFTEAYQRIIDAYGIPSYRELNPMPYTVITFPFLFAVMFGDMGHGAIMLTFAVTLIKFEDRIKRRGMTNEIFIIMFKGRYVILLMGAFSIFAGIVYNDFFSLPIFLYYSSWMTKDYRLLDYSEKHEIQLDPRHDFLGYPFPYGLDPIWGLAHNEITFTNAIKMKVAIILGVFQMAFGIILNLINHVHFKNYLAVFIEFIPQIVFFSCIFVYLVFLFFYKWIVYSADGPLRTSPGCAPSILISFIDMMMFMYHPNPDENCDPDMYPDQELTQKLLLICALSCVPVMLFVEPIIEIVKLKTNKNKDSQYLEEGIMSIWVHQFIHTIEFCLGSVSYTASYLRLWALSLAHYQLARVLWLNVLHLGTESSYGGIVTGTLVSMISFIFFAFFTVAVLVVIEGLSAFLHALRLHWMEFQSKFYIGLGHYFTPFSFRSIILEAKVPLDLKYKQ